MVFYYTPQISETPFCIDNLILRLNELKVQLKLRVNTPIRKSRDKACLVSTNKSYVLTKKKPNT